MIRLRALLLLIVLLILPLGGCVAWQPVTVTPQDLFADGAPERVRVTLNDGAQLVLESPVVRAGAIVATAAPGAALIEDIATLEVEQTSVIRSIGAVLPAVLILVMVRLSIERD